MADQYRHAHEQAGELPLRHIFLPSGSSPALPRAAHPAGGHALTSTVLTPAATRDSELHLTQQQIHQLEGLLEQARGQPDDLPLRGSPLKLFGSEYDTFTKAILTRFVDQARSTANSVQRAPAPEPVEPAPSAELAPRLNIKHFTRAGDYTDHDFMQNADHVFAHLQRKGLPADAARQNQPLLSHTQTTATSTPKLKPRDSLDMYSYSTRSHSDLPRTRLCSPPAAPSDYTALDRSSWASGARLCSTLALSDDHVDHASYTFDELSDLASHSSEHSSPVQPARNARSTRFHSPSPRLDDARGDLFPLFESSMTSVKQFMKPPKRRAAASTREANDTREPAAENLIKWKRASQLRLLSASSKANLPDKTHHSNKTRHSNKANHSNANAPGGADSHYVKGTVKPGAFPGQYGDMIFDAQENMWVSNDKKNDVGGSLDSIEDLFSDCDALKLHLQSRPGVLVQPDKAKDRRPLEVSFQFPASENSPVTKTHAADLTSVSECGNATFSQSNKELVSLITGSTNQIVWDTITSIDLSDKNIDRVENLEQYLPAVKSIDLSKNRLRFIEGLPLALFELDVTSNSLSDMASFHKFHDLQVVNASFNSFRSFSCLSNNVNLTKVNLMGNQIESLNGFPAIHALISLDLSRNHIRGHVHLENLQLPNLKELNLSENLISNITGIESLENLRILNVNENRIVALSCSRTHRRLKKLLCKFNDLNELKLDCFPFLRILRLDGNSLVSITGLKKLEHLHELSAKSQSSPQIVESFFRAAADVPSVDFSGNSSLVQLLPNISVDAFYNINQLNLSAVGLSILPGDFSEKFFNVRELNLSFNKLSDLKALQNLKQLKKLQVLSNNITKMEDILTGLQRSRKTLKSLDMRLNIINFEFYPYVFSPQELQLVKENHGKSAAESPIPIQALEDIESFTIHYNALSKSRNEWQARDNEFFRQMRKEGKDRRLKERLDYETILIGYFPNLKELDGSDVPHERRAAFGNLTGQ
ncbi:L domain-like protein [Metschnikowia bicuspidata var. bicuspidata NRRL YB-4993]|uniref:L domain-like protein n=1 Tax=Metschnikowia bicuspidata var. bicuspidata NRRL YB-4993 TaxID=869754 RepID=A0A1A0H8S9_9ASCO|nr:L domain-like protein [Metschnikowia bicuspidata var. bicuspidata NRRL YB-4993]OBA20416.1 L domain-like protein [Metschnikowia bicuspidata var. bicuspidata NRRL YB-4993]